MNVIESIKDLITCVHLNERFYVEEEKDEYVLIPPRAGTVMTVPPLEPVICNGKYLNRYGVELLMELGITVQKSSDIKVGNKKSYVIRGVENGKEITVQVYVSRDWKNPPNPLPPRDMWFVSNDTDEATPKYRVLKRFIQSKNFRVLWHECINRDNNLVRNCLGSNNGEGSQNNGGGIIIPE